MSLACFIGLRLTIIRDKSVMYDAKIGCAAFGAATTVSPQLSNLTPLFTVKSKQYTTHANAIIAVYTLLHLLDVSSRQIQHLKEGEKRP